MSCCFSHCSKPVKTAVFFRVVLRVWQDTPTHSPSNVPRSVEESPLSGPLPLPPPVSVRRASLDQLKRDVIEYGERHPLFAHSSVAPRERVSISNVGPGPLQNVWGRLTGEDTPLSTSPPGSPLLMANTVFGASARLAALRDADSQRSGPSSPEQSTADSIDSVPSSIPEKAPLSVISVPRALASGASISPGLLNTHLSPDERSARSLSLSPASVSQSNSSASTPTSATTRRRVANKHKFQSDFASRFPHRILIAEDHKVNQK
jgi:hypothetical protein